MCGIAGVYEPPEAQVSREVLLAMGAELHHRGPDSLGLYLDGRLGMVSTRLSIVDLVDGDQPIGNEDGRYWVVHNGEIYNHRALRNELLALGHRFHSHCDTEVIVHAYEQWGEACLHRFNGAFAFALWDRRSQELWLARDRLGIRPLFVAQRAGRLLFGSEAKALVRHPSLPRGLDPLGLLETFQLWATAPDRSALAGIREVEPGGFLRATADGRVREARWWQLPFGPDPAPSVCSEQELSEELLALLEDATRIRLRADVPVGAYLSGGLDSSAIGALIRRTSSVPRHFFALRFGDPAFDERVQQDRMAAYLDTTLHAIEVRSSDIAEVFPEVIRLAEKPMFRTAPAPMLLLSRLVRETGLKVVLTGEGADEVFAGYNIFRENKARRFWAKDPSSRLRPLLLSILYPYLSRDLSRTGAFLMRFFARGMEETDDPLYSHRLRFNNAARISGMLHPDVVASARQVGEPLERLRGRLPADFDSFGPLAKAQHLEIRTFMQGYLLHSQGDRMLSGNSIEGRFPFLDHRLVEFAAGVPERLRLKALREKYLLRRAVSGLLPADIGRREKRPYRAPILRALLDPRGPAYVRELLSDKQVAQAGLLDPVRIRRLLDKCGKGENSGVGENEEMALCGALSTMLLHHQLVESPVLAPKGVPGREVHGQHEIRSMQSRKERTC